MFRLHFKCCKVVEDVILQNSIFFSSAMPQCVYVCVYVRVFMTLCDCETPGFQQLPLMILSAGDVWPPLITLSAGDVCLLLMIMSAHDDPAALSAGDVWLPLLPLSAGDVCLPLLPLSAGDVYLTRLPVPPQVHSPVLAGPAGCLPPRQQPALALRAASRGVARHHAPRLPGRRLRARHRPPPAQGARTVRKVETIL